MRLSLYVCLSILLLSCNKSIKVDLIVYNALIYTVDNQFSTAESMAVKDGKIVAIGKNNDIDRKYSSEQRVDAKNKPIFPGLIDAHCHFTGYGLDLYKLNLIGTKSWDEILSKVLDYSKSYKEDWIYGRGWDQND